jgi:non-reducing end alpha-L-arabinofuranosidase
MQTKFSFFFTRLLPLVALLFVLIIVGASTLTAQQISSTPRRTQRPCDLFASVTPCVAAISTTRALYRDYAGPLYQVTRDSDKTTHNIGLLPDGYANATEQDIFCANSPCAITKLYDQSPNHNDLTPAPPGQADRGPGPNGDDVPARAKVLPIMIAGHRVYGITINPGTGYRNDHTRNIAINGQPEGVYMVTSALHLNSLCCFDFGNAETTNNDDDAGRMDAINIRYGTGTPVGIAANLDLENGLFGGLHVPSGTAFVTDMGVNNGQTVYALYQGDAQGRVQSGILTTTGPLPLRGKYKPMRKEGAIILGIGGDNSNKATGYFFEGVLTKGAPTGQSMNAVQANIIAAHYNGQLRP